MRIVIIVALFFMNIGKAQSDLLDRSTINIRLSFLAFPFTPLVTVEARTFNNFTLQFETNFKDTHGVNLKYYFQNRMDRNYVFIGTASVKNALLRGDLKATFLPYVGYGYAHRFGSSKNWIFDTRVGIGKTINADTNGVYPIIKTGIGSTF